MKIDSAYVGMESARLTRSSQTYSRSVSSSILGNATTGSALASENFGTFLNQKETDKEDNPTTTDEIMSKTVPEDILDGNTILSNALERMNSLSTRSLSDTRDVYSQFQKIHQKFLEQLYELLFGKRTCSNEYVDNYSSEGLEDAGQNLEIVATQSTSSFTYAEYECTTFNAAGIINTEDGRSINVNLDISMTSTFVATYSESVTNLSYRCVDPLVINMSDVPAGLSDLKFLFDIDADGEKEEISYLAEGSAFLALDKNGDGIINDGSELFGAASGDGFKDLAEYDSDGNGWIDENDAIFEKLKIWAKGPDGEDILYTLKDKDIGAICLKNADTQFSLTSDDHSSMNGYVRKTGFFLYESGLAGTLQHIDLVS